MKKTSRILLFSRAFWFTRKAPNRIRHESKPTPPLELDRWNATCLIPLQWQRFSRRKSQPYRSSVPSMKNMKSQPALSCTLSNRVHQKPPQISAAPLWTAATVTGNLPVFSHLPYPWPLRRHQAKDTPSLWQRTHWRHGYPHCSNCTGATSHHTYHR